MKFEEKIGEIPGKTRKKKANVIRKKQQPTTRRFYYKHIDKNTSKTDTNILKNRKDLFTEITDSEILQPLRQKPKPKPKPKQKAGKPKLSLNTYAKGLEQESKSFSSEKNKQKGEFQPYGFTTETGLPGNNNAVESVNNLFRHFLEPNTKPQMKDKWKRKHFMRKGFLLPQNKSLDENGKEEVNDENNRPNLQYNVSVLQNEVGEFLNPVVDFRKHPNQTLDSLKDVIPAATGDEKHKDIDTEMVEIGGDETLESDTDSEHETKNETKTEKETVTKPKSKNSYVFEDDILTEIAMGILLSLFPKDSETSLGAPGIKGVPMAASTAVPEKEDITTSLAMSLGMALENNAPMASTSPTSVTAPDAVPEKEDITTSLAMSLGMALENNPITPSSMDSTVPVAMAVVGNTTKKNIRNKETIKIALAIHTNMILGNLNTKIPEAPIEPKKEDKAIELALGMTLQKNPETPGVVPSTAITPESKTEDKAIELALGMALGNISETPDVVVPTITTTTPEPKTEDKAIELALGMALGIISETPAPVHVVPTVVPTVTTITPESKTEDKALELALGMALQKNPETPMSIVPIDTTVSIVPPPPTNLSTDIALGILLSPVVSPASITTSVPAIAPTTTSKTTTTSIKTTAPAPLTKTSTTPLTKTSTSTTPTTAPTIKPSPPNFLDTKTELSNPKSFLNVIDNQISPLTIEDNRYNKLNINRYNINPQPDLSIKNIVKPPKNHPFNLNQKKIVIK